MFIHKLLNLWVTGKKSLLRCASNDIFLDKKIGLKNHNMVDLFMVGNCPDEKMQLIYLQACVKIIRMLWLF
jgi:hypothetical protein